MATSSPISAFPAATVPLTGTELIPLAIPGTANTKITSSNLAIYSAPLQPSNSRNYFVDPCCRVQQNSATVNLSTAYQYGQVDLVQCKATGTAISAGTIIGGFNMSSGSATGWSCRISGATITGAGVVFARRWMENLDMANIIGPGFNNTITVSCVVQHNVGSNINYTITLNRANTPNNFSAVTLLGNTAAISVPSGVPTTISYTFSTANWINANGLEMIVSASCGAVTTKNFDFTDWSCVVGSNVLPIQPDNLSADLQKTYRYYERSYEYSTATGSATGNGAYLFANPIATGNANQITSSPFRVNKVINPTVVFYSSVTGTANKIRNLSTATDLAVTSAADTSSCGPNNNTGGALTADHYLQWHYTADARL